MPIYEYACGACGHQLEAFQTIHEEPLKKCPQCGKNKLQKLVSASRFQLKGEGWYKTDYGKKEKTDTQSSSPTSNENAPEAKKEKSANPDNTEKPKKKPKNDNEKAA